MEDSGGQHSRTPLVFRRGSPTVRAYPLIQTGVLTGRFSNIEIGWREEIRFDCGDETGILGELTHANRKATEARDLSASNVHNKYG